MARMILTESYTEALEYLDGWTFEESKNDLGFRLEKWSTVGRVAFLVVWPAEPGTNGNARRTSIAIQRR